MVSQVELIHRWLPERQGARWGSLDLEIVPLSHWQPAASASETPVSSRSLTGQTCDVWRAALVMARHLILAR